MASHCEPSPRLPCPSAELRRQKPAVNEPLPPPADLPALPAAAAGAAGDGIVVQGWTPAQLRQLAVEAYRRQLSPQLAALGYASSAAGANGGNNTASSSYSDEEGSAAVIDRLPEPSGPANGGSSRGSGSGSAESSPGAAGSGAAAWEAEIAAEIAAGEGPVLESLNRYLRRLEITAEQGSGVDDAGRPAALAAAIAAFDLPQTPDGCFPALFGRWAAGEGASKGGPPFRDVAEVALPLVA